MFSGLASYYNNLVGGETEQARQEAMLEKMRVGNQGIAYELGEVNFDHLRRKRAFLQGVNIELNAEVDKEELVGFSNIPDILPLKPKNEQLSKVDYAELMKTTMNDEELKEAAQSSTPGPNVQLFNYDTEDTAAKEAFLERFELIRKRKIKMQQPDGKPVAVIVNPYVSGSSVADEIDAVLYAKDIMHEIINCESQLDPYRKALELEIDNYSAIVAVGGDGTFNQMVNGMLARPDEKRVPVGLVPTGQCNDMARSLGLVSEGITHALETITNGETIAIDTTRILIDCDSESGLETSERRLEQCRHMLSNASLSMPAKIANGANTWKGCCGSSSSFSMSTYLQAFTCGFVADQYNLKIDDKDFADGLVNTAFMVASNGKYANGGMIMNPFAAMNDGLIDITWISDPAYMGTFGVTGILSEARGGAGIQAYKGHSQYVRGKKIRIEVPAPAVDEAEPSLELNDEAAATPQEPAKQVVIVDGEPMSFERSIQLECFPGNLEVFLNDAYFQSNKTFERRLSANVLRDRIIGQVVDKIWADFDEDHSGQLDKPETKAFLKKVLADLPPPNNYDETKFELTFTAIDKNQNGLIDKNEMKYFIGSMMR